MDGIGLSSVPQDVLLEIFSHFGPLERLRNASVCSRWRDVALDGVFWDEYMTSQYRTDVEVIKSKHQGHLDFWALLRLKLQDMEKPRALVKPSGKALVDGTTPKKQNFAKIGPMLLDECRMIANPYFWDLASDSWRLHPIHRTLKYLLWHDEIGVARIPSNKLHDAIFRADVSTCAHIGAVEPSSGELETWYQRRMMLYNMKKLGKSSSRHEIPMLLTASTLFISAALVRTTFTQHVVVSSVALLLSFPFVSRWTSFSLITQVVLPLISIHPAFQASMSDSWPSLLLSTVVAAPLVHFQHLMSEHVPWVFSIMACAGVYSRILGKMQLLPLPSNPSTNQTIAFESICNGLLYPLAIGFIADCPKHVSLQAKRLLPRWAPRFCSRAADAIIWWNRKVERLESIWAIFSGNLRWMSVASQEQRDEVKFARWDFMFQPGGRKDTAVFVIASTVAGFSFTFFARWLQNKFFPSRSD